MGTIPAWLLTHSCTITPWRGTSGDGADVFGDPVTVSNCFIDESRTIARGNAANNSPGDAIVSGTKIFAPLSLDTSAFLAGSRVTYVSGPTTRVAFISGIQRRDGGGLPTPDHVEITCGG
jgi:hypothetical protein